MTAGTLYVVATPIGNLADSSSRALEVLRQVALVACEDTRVSRKLLAHYGIATPVIALHRHNERRATEPILRLLRGGLDAAVISDAGTPGISDPGAQLVDAAHAEGIPVLPVPGPSAAIAAMSVSGFEGTFRFAGFLPTHRGEREHALDHVQASLAQDAVVLYEAPHRIARLLEQLRQRLGDRHRVLIGRELTKKFEETARIPLGAAADWLAASAHRQSGEFVLVLAPLEAPPKDRSREDVERVLDILLGLLPPAHAARAAAKITGVSRNEVYRLALARRH